jgi:hypothetical protein
LREVGEALTVSGNANLTTLTMDNLREVGEALTVSSNANLNSVGICTSLTCQDFTSGDVLVTSNRVGSSGLQCSEIETWACPIEASDVVFGIDGGTTQVPCTCP